jgi:hypothetical protein
MFLQCEHLGVVDHQDVDRVVTTAFAAATAAGSTGSGTSGGCD